MKTIKLSNGEIRKGYEFADLNQEAQDKVLTEQIEFEIQLMQGDEDREEENQSDYFYLALEMEKMKTPWFLASEIYNKHKAELIDTIEVNGYLFDEEGEMLPITYHTKGNEVVRITYGKKEYEAEFITI